MTRLCTIIIATSALLWAACPPRDGGPGEERKTPALKRAVVVLQPGGRTVRVDAEVVESEQDRARGLMFRKELAARSGMLFIFDRQEVQTFWMKNTYISLDMLFIDEAMKVVGMVENADPMTEERRQVKTPSRYVLEVKGGFCKREGIKAGTGEV